MKKALIGSAIIFCMITIISLTVQNSPKPITKTLAGIKYQLGPENADNTEKIIIEVDGTLKKHLFNRKYHSTFEGTMKIGDINLPPENANGDMMKIKFWKGNDAGSITFFFHDYTGYNIDHFGSMFIGDDFNELTVIVMQKRESGKSGGWSSRNGLMISAPASNREESVQISNKLMEKYLLGANPLE